MPVDRIGPRPIPVHLNFALTALFSAAAALPAVLAKQFHWAPELADDARALQPALANAAPAELAAAVAAECETQLSALLTGISLYHAHPYRRTLADPPVVWQNGTTRLLDYGGDGAPLLLIPSLVNRAYILDLTEESSLLRWLSRQGFRSYLVDWGAPGPTETEFGLTDYIERRLAPMLAQISAEHRRPAGVIGYCMGGNLALALALRHRAEVDALALLATPWDFHQALPEPALKLAQATASWELILTACNELPIDILQTMFALLDPDLASRKFSRFAGMDQSSDAARSFVALEDWLNDGVPLTVNAARDCILGWYGRNTPATRRWRVAGEVVDPRQFTGPAFLAVPSSDRIVPPKSALNLADALAQATVLRPPSGHIGMVVSRRAELGLWQPLAAWLSRHL